MAKKKKQPNRKALYRSKKTRVNKRDSSISRFILPKKQSIQKGDTEELKFNKRVYNNYVDRYKTAVRRKSTIQERLLDKGYGVLNGIPDYLYHVTLIPIRKFNPEGGLDYIEKLSNFNYLIPLKTFKENFITAFRQTFADFSGDESYNRMLKLLESLPYQFYEVSEMADSLPMFIFWDSERLLSQEDFDDFLNQIDYATRLYSDVI